MATSSITHNFVVRDPESVNRFVRALDLAEMDRANREKKSKQALPGRQLTDSSEILSLMAKRKKRNA